MHSAQAPRAASEETKTVARAAVIYGIESLMNEPPWDENFEDGKAAISSEMKNKDSDACAGTTHVPKRSSRRMADEAEREERYGCRDDAGDG